MGIIANKRGDKKLCLAPYMYTVNITVKNTVTWRCVKRFVVQHSLYDLRVLH